MDTQLIADMGPGFYLHQAAGRLVWHLDTQVKNNRRVQAFVYSVDPANAEASAGAIHLASQEGSASTSSSFAEVVAAWSSGTIPTF